MTMSPSATTSSVSRRTPSGLLVLSDDVAAATRVALDHGGVDVVARTGGHVALLDGLDIGID
jgi:hypothetical protein